jgi:hypothetical protein
MPKEPNPEREEANEGESRRRLPEREYELGLPTRVRRVQ